MYLESLNCEYLKSENLEFDPSSFWGIEKKLPS